MPHHLLDAPPHTHLHHPPTCHCHPRTPHATPPQVDLPVFYGNKMRRKMKAGAGCEDLKVRCPHYYTVAQQLHAAQQACLTADEEFPAFILNTFRSRYKVRVSYCCTVVLLYCCTVVLL